MKNIHKLTVCALLLFSALNIFARADKQRALIINNSGSDIYCRPASGNAKTIGNKDQDCMVASTSGAKVKIGPIEICYKTDWNLYEFVVDTSSSQTTYLQAELALANVTNNASIKNENIAVVTNQGIGQSPAVQIYSGEKAYKAANPNAPAFIACGNLNQY